MKLHLALSLGFVLFQGILTNNSFAITSTTTHQSAKVAAAVARLGTGSNSIVALRLQYRSAVKGQISSIDGDSFLVTDSDSGMDYRIPYGQVARLEGANIDNGTQVHVGGGFRAGLARTAGLLFPMRRVQANSLTGDQKTLLVGILVGVLLAIVLAKVF